MAWPGALLAAKPATSSGAQRRAPGSMRSLSRKRSSRRTSSTRGGRELPSKASNCWGEMQGDTVSTEKLQGEAASAWTGHRLSVKTREAVFPMGRILTHSQGTWSWGNRDLYWRLKIATQPTKE